MNNNEQLKRIKLFLLDMDGTIYLDNELFDGTKEFLEHIKKIGGRYAFLTNNSSKSVDKYIEKLAGMGIEATEDDFVTSVNATSVYLKNKGYKKIYVSGTRSFEKQLVDDGLNVTTEISGDIDCLCMGFDTELSFEKLEKACILLGRDIDYIATNPDWVCPTAYGSVPDCGSIAQILCNATKRMPVFIGKPKPEMIELALEKYGFEKGETAIVGDRLYTDIASGVNAGISSVFVLSGEGTLADLENSDVSPEFICKDIKEILNIIKES